MHHLRALKIIRTEIEILEFQGRDIISGKFTPAFPMDVLRQIQHETKRLVNKQDTIITEMLCGV